MTPSFRATTICLVILALAAWLMSSLPGGDRIAVAQPTLQLPSLKTIPSLRTKAQFAALRDHDDDEDHGEHEDNDYDEEDGEDEEEELEIEYAHVELERLHLQAIYGELELVTAVASIVKDADSTGVMAVLHVKEVMEEDEAEKFLLEIIERSSSLSVKRIARIQLAELYGETDQVEKVKEQIRALALGE